MRQIKFRAWDRRSLKFFDMRHFAILPDGIQVNEPGIGPVFIRQDYELMQYTGLQDENDVEIYDGDIVKLTLNFETTEEEYWNEETVAVVWKTDGWFVGDYRLGDYASTNEWGRTVEVIGNVHENRDLLPA